MGASVLLLLLVGVGVVEGLGVDGRWSGGGRRWR
jgi:hypothetical protein